MHPTNNQPVVDYSQVELQVFAHLSATLSKALQQGEDIHARVASEVYEVSLDKVTPAMRRRAKDANFGVIYGQSPHGLARKIKESR